MKFNKKFIVLGMALVTVATSVSIFGLKYSNSNNKDEIQINDSTSVKSNGVEIKLLKTESNSLGEKTQTFSYTINPANATNQDVIVSLAYIDGTNCDEVMEYKLDQDNKQITLNCKKAFSKQIKCVITSVVNSKATSTVMLDYVKKITEVRYNSDLDPYEINIGTYDSDIDDYDNAVGNLFPVYAYLYNEIDYSVYTKDYNYNLKVVDMHCKLNLEETPSDIVNLPVDNKELYDILKEDSSLVEGLENFVNQGFEEEKSFTDDDLYNISTNEKWHNYLIKRAVRPYSTKTNMITFDLTPDSEKCITLQDTNSGTKYSVDVENIPIRLSLWGKYDKYVVNVDSLNSEIFNLDF